MSAATGSAPVLVAVAEQLHEAALLVSQRAHALRRDFLQQLVHAALVGLAALRLALLLAGLAALLPALPPAQLRLGRGRGRLVALQAGVALREVVGAEQQVLAAGLQDDPLLLAGHVD